MEILSHRDSASGTARRLQGAFRGCIVSSEASAKKIYTTIAGNWPVCRRKLQHPEHSQPYPYKKSPAEGELSVIHPRCAWMNTRVGVGARCRTRAFPHRRSRGRRHFKNSSMTDTRQPVRCFPLARSRVESQSAREDSHVHPQTTMPSASPCLRAPDVQ